MPISNFNSDEIADLQAIRLEEAEELLQAIRNGSVDALVVSGARGERVRTLHGAEHTYRLIVETIDHIGLKCFVCNQMQALIRLTITDDILVMNACVCSNCAKLMASPLCRL